MNSNTRFKVLKSTGEMKVLSEHDKFYHIGYDSEIEATLFHCKEALTTLEAVKRDKKEKIEKLNDDLKDIESERLIYLEKIKMYLESNPELAF